MYRPVKLTESHCKKLPVATKGDDYYPDTEVPGLLLRISEGGRRVFMVDKRLKTGRRYRSTLGEISMGLTAARDRALELLADIGKAKDPDLEQAKRISGTKRERATEQAKALTLEQAFSQYLESRTLKPTTVKDYERIRDTDFKNWKDRRLVDITPTMVAKRHRRLLEQAQKQSKRYCRKATGARANNAMRVLRAVFNHAAHILDEHGVELRNPVARLTATKSWNPANRKSTYLSEKDLPKWWAALGEVESVKMKDFLRLVLFTGLRRDEAATLLWDNVDFDDRTLKIIDPKNHRDHVLPLSDFVFTLLKQRKEDKGKSCFVFPGRDKDKDNPLVSPWKTLRALHNNTGISASVHDLRRTFAVVAANTVPYPVVKRLLNHKANDDVTLAYATPDLAELRQPMQRVTDRLMRLATKTTADVVQLRG